MCFVMLATRSSLSCKRLKTYHRTIITNVLRKDCQHELVTSHKRSLLPFFQLSLQQNSNDYSTTSQKFPNAAQRLHDLEADDAAKRDQLYQKSADLVLLSLHDLLESADYSDVIDGLDFKDGVLEICLANDKGTIVLNKHYIHRQIWYSAPNSGADYFDFVSTPRWTSQRCGNVINHRLSTDLEILTGRHIEIPLPQSLDS